MNSTYYSCTDADDYGKNQQTKAAEPAQIITCSRDKHALYSNILVHTINDATRKGTSYRSYNWFWTMVVWHSNSECIGNFYGRLFTIGWMEIYETAPIVP